LGEVKLITRIVVVDLRKGVELLDKKPMIDGNVTERKSDEETITLTLDTGYTVFLHLEEE